MRERVGLRIRIRHGGGLEIVDPDPSVLDLVRAIDPGFVVRTAPLPAFREQRLARTRKTGVGCSAVELAAMSLPDLRNLHERIRYGRGDRRALDRSAPSSGGAARSGKEGSWLDLKCELARRILADCRLCGARCRVDRTAGKIGRCGLGPEAEVYDVYTHIAEEPPINPTLYMALRGCGMRCRMCQQSPAMLGARKRSCSGRPVRTEASDPERRNRVGGADRGDPDDLGPPAEILGPGHWQELKGQDARTLAFIGGNPTESLPAILSFLRHMPPSMTLPLGWNCSGYDAREAIRLLDGICDFYVPDAKFGNERCAVKIAGASGYPEVMTAAIEEMCVQGVPVLVRILVLPGHLECCHLPVLHRLRPSRDRVVVHVLGGYVPDHRVRDGRGRLGRRVTAAERDAVVRAARSLGFKILDTAVQSS